MYLKDSGKECICLFGMDECVFHLHVCKCTSGTQCLLRLEENTDPLELESKVVMCFHVDDGD